MRRGIVWDLDDTLIETGVQTLPKSHWAAANAMVQAGLNAAPAAVYQARLAAAEQLGTSEIDLNVAREFGGDHVVAEAGRTAFLSEDVGFLVADKNVVEMLKRLSATFDHHLLTKGHTPRQIRKIIEANLSEHFASIHVVSSSGLVQKLHVIKSVLESYGDARNVIVVGDKPDGEIAAGLQLGAHCIRVVAGEHSSQPLGSTTHRCIEIQSVLDVESVLQGRFFCGA